MNNRPKIASLCEKELAQLLIQLFFITGKELKLAGEQTKIFLEEVYKKQGGRYVDDFMDAFSKYAAFELPEAENLTPNVSPRFISILMKLYDKNRYQANSNNKSLKSNSTTLTPEEKYILFIQFVSINKCLPGNADWVCIFEYFTGLKKIAIPQGWDAMPYQHKWKHALNKLAEWGYKSDK